MTALDTLVLDYGALDDRLLLMENHVATHYTTETDTMSHLLITLTEAASAHQEDIDVIASMAIETSQDLINSTNQVRQQVHTAGSQIQDLKLGYQPSALVSSSSVSLTTAQISAAIDAHTMTCGPSQDHYNPWRVHRSHL